MNRAHGRRTAIALTLLVTLLLAGACAQEHPEPPTGDAARGQDLWVRSACASCHGAAAEGAAGGPALVDTPLSLRDVTGLVRRGTVNMPPFSPEQLSDQDLQDIYAWWHNPLAFPESTGTGVCTDACGAPATDPGGGFGPAPTSAASQDPWPQSPCAGCHGTNAQGGAGPALAGRSLSLADFQSAVRQGPGSMPAYSTAELSDQALQALFDSLQAPAVPVAPPADLPATATPEVPAAPPADLPATATPAVQQHLWLQAGCAACHGQQAEGGSGPRLAGEDWEYDKYVRKVREGDDGMPAFSSDRLSDADMRAIYDWLLAGAPVP
ncbi:MAG TPA: cytochrome c [Anaerolineae bacterium]|nr:cytochrome c [Anaerolineae bacterium]